jgi:hypothetical protein
MRGNAATQDIPVLIVHPEVGELEYGARPLSPLARQVLLNEWGFDSALPSEKLKLDDSVIQLFLYASSPDEQLLVHIYCDPANTAQVESGSPYAARCVELSQSKSDFVLGVPISVLSELIRADYISRIAAA